MKFWRTTSVVALAGALSAGTAFAALTPKAPKAAGKAISCLKITEKTLTHGLVMCPEMLDDTQTEDGNAMPWQNSTFFFSTFRNQYLYPSNTVNDTRKIACTMESIQARAVSFASPTTSVYGLFSNGDPSSIVITDATSDTLVTDFATNTGTTPICSITSADAGGQLVIATTTGVNGSTLSTCTTCPMGDMWCQVGPDEATFNSRTNILVDTTLALTDLDDQIGDPMWDTTTTSFGQGCNGPQRAFGSGSFMNSQHLTTALGIDDQAFVWVFKGLVPPQPMTVEQQIAEIVRLLLTPEGLRCSGLDLNPGNGVIEDDPIMYPMGSRIDPISQQISTNGTITGDELVDDLRHCGWLCP